MLKKRTSPSTALADLPIELLGSILFKVQGSDCKDDSPVCFALACKATHAAWKQRFASLKPHNDEGRQVIMWLAARHRGHAARVLLENGLPDPAAALAALAAITNSDYSVHM